MSTPLRETPSRPGTPSAWVRISMLYGSKALAATLGVVCFFVGMWWGHGELDGLLATPPGGLYLEPRTRTVWSVFPDNPQILQYSRIPTPEQARLSKLFPTVLRQEEKRAETATTVPPTTTTSPKRAGDSPRWVEIPNDASPVNPKE